MMKSRMVESRIRKPKMLNRMMLKLNMAKRNLIIAVCCVLILCVLSGCQLAKESAGANAYGDKMIGLFITTEYLDLFDFDGYLNDYFNRFRIGRFRGGEINIDGNTDKYQGRLYAELVPVTFTNEETGETMVTHEYVFEGVEGMLYFVPIIQSADGEDSCFVPMSDPAISDMYMGVSHSEHELKGTIYVIPTEKNRNYYYNPVYQNADGSVYAVSGTGIIVSNENYASVEGAVISQTMKLTTTITENGKTKKDSISIEISISIMLAPVKIVILQMDSDNTILSQRSYEPEAMPEVFTLEARTAYLIVETHKRDEMGTIIITREIYDRGVDSIATFFAREDGVCVKHWTWIKAWDAIFYDIYGL